MIPITNCCFLFHAFGWCMPRELLSRSASSAVSVLYFQSLLLASLKQVNKWNVKCLLNNSEGKANCVIKKDVTFLKGFYSRK